MSGEFETIRLEVDGRGVARLVLNRPEKHNVLNAVMIDELTLAARRLGVDASVRAVVLSGEGKSFCAGGDLTWMKAQLDATRPQRMDQAGRLAGMLKALDEMPKLLIAVVQGAAYGGGVGMVAISDIAIGADDCMFALTETKLGLIPATISPFVFRRIGAANLRRFALNSRLFDAATAQAIGLLSETAPGAACCDAVNVHVEAALACAPEAIADAKRLFRGLALGSVSTEDTIAALADRWESREARDGIESFLARQKSRWLSQE